ncbi:MAG: ribose 5-phosphate isomerase B [Candidatus Neomarinimicrobiota bacterium]|nr:MAG: ribose 5-phosphate isomerase B [Candidatus Neomarinimicrobiota bacterium]
MIIAIGSDHGGIELKSALIQYARQLGHTVTDCGTFGPESVDYTDYAQIVAKKVTDGEAERGILICKSGIGMSISANKVRGIRAALVYNEEVAALSRKHNDANIICFGASFVDIESAKKRLNIWLKTDFEGGRHQIRVDKIEKV